MGGGVVFGTYEEEKKCIQGFGGASDGNRPLGKPMQK